MSEAKKHFNEIRGAWIGFIGSLGAIIFSLVFIIGGPSLYIRYPGPMNDITTVMSQSLLQVVVSANIQSANVISIMVLIPAIVSLVISLYRSTLGVSLSGLLLPALMGICLAGFILFFSFLTIAQLGAQDIFRLSLLYISGGGTPSSVFLLDPDMFYGTEITMGWASYYYWVPELLLILLIAIGGTYMLAARPLPVAKFRRNRMKMLAKADNFERTGKPQLAIRFYERAADLSMKLKEEDKATEYYSKARQIHETAVEAALKIEEEKKRKELAERRAKLEEERKEILMKADEAEEKEEWGRAFNLYREAADRSVDLGQKKLAAQFTAKSKELLRKQKEKEKKESRDKEEEKRRKDEFERKKEEMKKKVETKE